jgi:VWFA-related protein
LAAAAAVAPLRGEPTADPQPPLVEHVEVRLVEVVVRVVDRQGRPVTDVTASDVKVHEGGDERRVAYFEAASTKGPDLAGGTSTPATALYDAAGHEVQSKAAAVVLPAKPRRRVVLAFDASNSKVRRRAEWKTSARAWIESSMQPDDQVSIVTFKTVPIWIQPPTADKSVLLGSLDSLDLEGSGVDRDRQKEMGVLVDELGACADQSETGKQRGMGEGSPDGPSNVSDEASCAYQIAEPYVTEWATQTAETVDALRTLTGQLAAMDGRKVVMLFSEGVIPDPTQLVMNAMLSIFGANRVPISNFTFKLQRDSQEDLTALHAAARSAGVVFYTFDTRGGGDRGSFETPAYNRPQGTQTLGINPWVETYRETSGTLAVLADETGGRPYYGTNGLAGHLKDAVDSYRAVFNLGFYRPSSVNAPGKLRIQVARKGVEIKYPKRAMPRIESRAARLDVSIRKPEFSGRGDRQWLPVVVQMALDELPLRRVSNEDGCQVGVFLQAVRPDGTIGDETYAEAVVAIPKTRPDKRKGLAPFQQILKLELPPGPYRLFARLSDDRQEILGSRTVDLTLAPGAVQGGIVP